MDGVGLRGLLVDEEGEEEVVYGFTACLTRVSKDFFIALNTVKLSSEFFLNCAMSLLEASLDSDILSLIVLTCDSKVLS